MIPNGSTKTWIILGLSAALLAIILAVPWLRTSIGAWLMWVGGLLAAGAREAQKPPPSKTQTPEKSTQTEGKESVQSDLDQAEQDISDTDSVSEHADELPDL